MLCANPSLWRHCALAVGIELCHSLLPTNMKVWNIVEEPVYRNSTESRCFDYLRRFIFTLSTESLSLLLRFVTGSPHCVNQTVSVLIFLCRHHHLLEGQPQQHVGWFFTCRLLTSPFLSSLRNLEKYYKALTCGPSILSEHRTLIDLWSELKTNVY